MSDTARHHKYRPYVIGEDIRINKNTIHTIYANIPHAQRKLTHTHTIHELHKKQTDRETDSTPLCYLCAQRTWPGPRDEDIPYHSLCPLSIPALRILLDTEGVIPDRQVDRQTDR